MASMRDIKRRKGSISSTQQITKAMKLVSTVKLQRAKGKAETTKPYFDCMYDTIATMLSKSDNIDHPYLKAADAGKTAVLCGYEEASGARNRLQPAAGRRSACDAEHAGDDLSLSISDGSVHGES